VSALASPRTHALPSDVPPTQSAPSSQFSESCFTPSPQRAQPADGVQVKPSSRAQVASQPSPETRLPSSQVSLDSTAPLPHFSQVTPGVTQMNPASRRHVSEQPSLASRLPSSHVSSPSIVPLPHS